jgi:hypothetical protein
MRALDFEVGDFESGGRRAEEAFNLPGNAHASIWTAAALVADTGNRRQTVNLDF